jgi:hypothetical protein
VSQCLARFQETPKRWRARRMASPLSTRPVQPFSWQTWAAKLRVHRLVGLPKPRGLWWSKARKSSSRSLGQAAWTVLGALDLACRQAVPSVLKALMASRTVWAAQPRAAAMWDGRWPWSLCSRIWQRRSVNASGERRP